MLQYQGLLPYQALEPFEAEFFRVLNAFVEPMVRAGLGSPGLWPTGAIVLETTGRKTGRTFNVPVVATLVGDLVVVSTVRRRSQWVKNLASHPDLRYWMGGRAHDATAFVVTPGLQPSPSDEMPPLARSLVAGLVPLSNLWGASFAVLAPASQDRGSSQRGSDRIAGPRAAPAERAPVAPRRAARPA
jgi:deazaflavin-dependent oxidoreductase (nitroreductase family)